MSDFILVQSVGPSAGVQSNPMDSSKFHLIPQNKIFPNVSVYPFNYQFYKRDGIESARQGADEENWVKKY